MQSFIGKRKQFEPERRIDDAIRDVSPCKVRQFFSCFCFALFVVGFSPSPRNAQNKTRKCTKRIECFGPIWLRQNDRGLSFNIQSFSKFEFPSVHLSGIRFMIIAAKMQNAVENQLFDLSLKQKAVFCGLRCRLLDRDHEVEVRAHRRPQPHRQLTHTSTSTSSPCSSTRAGARFLTILAVRPACGA